MIVFLMIAFQLAWPAFAYSIGDDSRGASAHTRTCSPTCCFISCWMSLALGVLAPWLVDLLAPRGGFYARRRRGGVPGFRRRRVRRLHRARDRDRPRAADAVQLDRQRRRRPLVNIALNFALIPPYGMMGAAVATLVAYVVLFVGMWLNSQRVYPVAVPVAPRR